MAERGAHPLLSAYAAAWRLGLPALRAAAAADRLARRLGLKLVPAAWDAEGRLLRDPRGPGAEEKLWLHCASLGEAKGLWVLAEAAAAAGRGLVLTASTAEGLAYLQARAAGLPRITARIAPFDHPALVAAFLRRYRVDALFLYETEVWPHFILACARGGIPVHLVSARLTPAAARRYRLPRVFWAALLDRLAWIQAQAEADAERFRALTRAPVETGADFKAAHFAAAIRPRAPGADGFAFLSLHASELAFFLPILPSLMQRFALKVFPRHLRELPRFRSALLPLGFALRSRDSKARHLLVDSHGQVADMLPACHSAFVGGSLAPIGCHNLWEPAAAGLRVYFGPHHAEQAEAARLLLADGLGEVVRERGQALSWKEPGPAERERQAAGCMGLLEARRAVLAAALDAFRSRIAEVSAARRVPRDFIYFL